LFVGAAITRARAGHIHACQREVVIDCDLVWRVAADCEIPPNRKGLPDPWARLDRAPPSLAPAPP